LNLANDHSEPDIVRIEEVDDVVTIWLNRPKSRNALSRALYHRLGDAIDVATEKSQVRFVVIRGSDGQFSAGKDLKEAAPLPETEWLSDHWRRMGRTVIKMRLAEQVIVAAVEGTAAGAGAAMALGADIVIAEENARFRFNFVHLGLLPDAGTTRLLPTLIGLARARDLVLSGRWIGAVEAHSIGLIARLSEPGQMSRQVTDLLCELREAPGRALALAKNLLDGSTIPDFATVVRRESIYQLAARSTGDYIKRIEAMTDALHSRDRIAE
jgi:2-(1,2-epoxy-1,2-dihydrophenyl)acetyl-CoA isomerase